MNRPALQIKQVGVSRMAFRARKVFGTFEKRAPGRSKFVDMEIDGDNARICFFITPRCVYSRTKPCKKRDSWNLNSDSSLKSNAAAKSSSATGFKLNVRYPNLKRNETIYQTYPNTQ